MARGKKNKEPRQAYNPYFGKPSDESHMAKKPFFTWLLVIPGLILGALLGRQVVNLPLGLLFGAIMGIAVGSLIDKRREPSGPDDQDGKH